ncbi:HAD-superfamily subfamily IIA hydrolase [Polychaeton citri CBS 116435]|uniref:HAD-superfamily subfamily IIA hydrolase n=1 Tax=Polychaeton citri CBS 116435 TaxID=1314669 RepID=A0A9P4QBA2_9PEZI|nr:HAD-superfamily subfamily IIA hydrolase [Polychaeton citri CBS 116435]
MAEGRDYNIDNDATAPLPYQESMSGVKNTAAVGTNKDSPPGIFGEFDIATKSPLSKPSVSDSTMEMDQISASSSATSGRTSGTQLHTPLSSRAKNSFIRHNFDPLGDKASIAKDMAFVFDIDGVFVHGNRPLPQSKRMLEILNRDNKLDYPISPRQSIQAHTLMRALAQYYKTVLIVGGEGYQCRKIAERYGFKGVIVSNDIIAWDSTVAPFRTLTDFEPATTHSRDFSTTKFDAIMVFSDSRDYATDMQIIMDILRSENGHLGTIATKPQNQVPVYFSQSDLLCPSEHSTPRISQGTFRISLEGIYKALTGQNLECVVYRKPELATCQYADKNIYMIGDNPAFDIKGGNAYGWNTCLVRTGIFQGGENDEDNPLSFGISLDALTAVTTAMKKELGDDFRF